MRTIVVSHFSDQFLRSDLKASAADEYTATAALIARIAEFDARKLYLPDGYDSMYAWCVGELPLSEDAVYTRIRAARVSCAFPAVLTMLADGRLHLAGLMRLAPYLTSENSAELLMASADRSRSEIEAMLAHRYPRSELLPFVVPVAAAQPVTNLGNQLVPGRVALDDSTPSGGGGGGGGTGAVSGSAEAIAHVRDGEPHAPAGPTASRGHELAPGVRDLASSSATVGLRHGSPDQDEHPILARPQGEDGDAPAAGDSPRRPGSPDGDNRHDGLNGSDGFEASAPRIRIVPIAPTRFMLQISMGKEMHDDLRYAQSLLAHVLPEGDLVEVLHRGLKALIRERERRKFAAAVRPRPGQPPSSVNPRYIPAHVKRSVWERDGGQCTFVSEAGHRCGATRRLEFDHVVPVARGGGATIDGLRLRCRPHNQYEAERALGAGFMARKREEARTLASAASASRPDTRGAVTQGDGHAMPPPN